MPAISILRNTPEALLASLYADPYILRAGNDNHAISAVKHPLVEHWSAWADGLFMGCLVCVKYTKTETEFHARLLKAAIPFSREIGREAMRIVFSDQNVMRVTCYVMQGLEKAKNYCLRLGFSLEGIKRDAVTKNGLPRDVYMLGITRKDYEK